RIERPNTLASFVHPFHPGKHLPDQCRLEAAGQEPPGGTGGRLAWDDEAFRGCTGSPALLANGLGQGLLGERGLVSLLDQSLVHRLAGPPASEDECPGADARRAAVVERAEADRRLQLGLDLLLGQSGTTQRFPQRDGRHLSASKRAERPKTRFPGGSSGVTPHVACTPL